MSFAHEKTLFLVQQQQPEEFCWATLGPSDSPKTSCQGLPGDSKQQLQKQFLSLGGDASLETTILAWEKAHGKDSVVSC